MKQTYLNLIFITCSIFFTACSNDDNNAPQNTAPTKAYSIYPTLNQVSTEATVNFQWTPSTDENNDLVEYTLRLYTDYPSSETYVDSITSELNLEMTLERGKSYYWEVIASDGVNQTSGDFRQFSIITETNTIPSKAFSIYPIQDQTLTETTVNFRWAPSTDTEGKAIEYTLRLYTDYPRTETYIDNITTELNLEMTLEKGKSYYWEVLASDGVNQTSGDFQQFSISTENNTAPTKAFSIYPTLNQLCTETTINFQWAPSTDQNGDPLEYTLRLYTDYPNTEIYVDSITSELNLEMTLERGKAYYWEVLASDGINQTSGDFHQFYTESDAISNYAPYAPELVSPELLSSNSIGSTTLEWSCVDLDDDELTYKIYLGTDIDSLELIEENLSSNSYEITTEAGQQYFWYVIASDPSGTSTQGQTWSFYTE